MKADNEKCESDSTMQRVREELFKQEIAYAAIIIGGAVVLAQVVGELIVKYLLHS